MKLHSPTAILHSGQICLKFWETPEPNPCHYPVSEQLKFSIIRQYWLALARIVPFMEQEEVAGIIWNTTKLGPIDLWSNLDKGIPLDSIADRIQVKDFCKWYKTPNQCEVGSSCINDCKVAMAVINPVEVVESETQEEIYESLLFMFMNFQSKESILNKFHLKRKTK